MKQYSAEDIWRYLKGEMSAEEMHAIETAALEDPFLADAIDGFQMAMSSNEEGTISGLERLRHEIGQRTRPEAKVVKMPGFHWWWVSAAAMILLITGVALYNNWMISQQSGSTLAVSQKQQLDTTPSTKAEDEKALSPRAADSLVAGNAGTTSPVSGSKSTPPEGTQSRKDEPTASALFHQRDAAVTHPPAAEKDLTKKDVEQSETPKKPQAHEEYRTEAKPSLKEGVTASAPLDELARKNQDLKAQLNYFSGRVIDQNNKPLANANIQVVQNKSNILTDEHGGFNFSAKDSVIDVQVGMVGFERRNFRLQNNLASNNLVLEPAKADLQEVVVTGYGARKKKESSKMTTRLQNAVPVGGWIEYEKYLEKNKRPPVNNPLMTGDVVVSFEVNRSTPLTDFRIEQSLSTEYDKEAIRLIQEGPSWRLVHGRKTRITVIVKF